MPTLTCTQAVQICTGAMSTATCSRVSSSLWRHW